MKLSHLICAALVVGTSASALAQTTITQLWRLEDTVSPAPAWLNAGDTTRGSAFNAATGNLLVADRDGTSNTVRILNGTTGAEVGSIPQSPNYASGTFVLNKVLPVGDGTVYVVNLAGNNNLKIYRHASETATQTEAAFEVTNFFRTGDDAAINGTGNATKIVVSGSNNPNLGVFTTTDAGLTFTSSTLIPSTALLGISNQAFSPDGSKILSRRSTNSTTDALLLVINASTGVVESTQANKAGYGPLGVAVVGSKTLLGTAPTIFPASNFDQTGIVAILEEANFATNTFTPLFNTVPLGRTPLNVANGNGAGDLSFDTANRRVYVHYTNNSISAHTIPAYADVQDWNLF